MLDTALRPQRRNVSPRDRKLGKALDRHQRQDEHRNRIEHRQAARQ
jgi:hypothetical protein